MIKLTKKDKELIIKMIERETMNCDVSSDDDIAFVKAINKLKTKIESEV